MNNAVEFDSAYTQYRKWTEYSVQLLGTLFTTQQFRKDCEFWGIISLPMNPTQSFSSAARI